MTLFISCQEATIGPEETAARTPSSPTIHCPASSTVADSNDPQTIEEMMNLINELPKPLDIPCLMSVLKRPLKIQMTNSKLSAQPAEGNDSPRIFIFKNDLVISIVPAGPGSELLEVSEMYSDTLSLKGELKFPLYEDIPLSAPYDRIDLGNGRTTCQQCHNSESQDSSITYANAFTSVALKPETSVKIYDFSNDIYQCELAAFKSYRCRMILAIFQDNQVEDVEFPNNTPTWLESIL